MYDESRALFFLQAMNYDVDEAIALLKPFSPEISDNGNANEDDDDDAGGFDGDDLCFLCRDGGNLIVCEQAGCHKVYHPACLKMDKVPLGVWECPHHTCLTCRNKAASDRYASLLEP